MRIVIDLQGAQTESRFRGIGRYSLSLAKAIVRNKGEHEVIIALNGLFPETIELIREEFCGLLPQENIVVWVVPGPVRESMPDTKFKREAAELIREAFLASLSPEVVLVSSLFEGAADDAATSISNFISGSFPTVVIFYDLIPLLNPKKYLAPNPLYKEYYMNKVKYLKVADGYLAISDFSAHEVTDVLQLDPSKVVNISTACDSIFRKLPQTELADIARFGITESFILYSGGSDDRKNLPRLIEAFALLPDVIKSGYQLVMAGKMPEDKTEQFRKIAVNVQLKENEYIFTGYVTTEELVSLYNQCRLFVLPSLQEGFGLPALEAINCGAPVIGSNTTSIPEVIGVEDALFNPLDVADMAGKIERALTDEHFRDILIQREQKQISKFSWDESAKRAVYFIGDISAHNTSTCFSTQSELEKELIIKMANVARDNIYSEDDLVGISKAIAYNFPVSSSKQIFIDISELVNRDAKSGVQRVTRSVLKELTSTDFDHCLIASVYAKTSEIGYRYANEFISAFSDNKIVQRNAVVDDFIEFKNGDIFIGLDLQHQVICSQLAYFQQMHRMGVRIWFVVYDLLPILNEECFMDGMKETHLAWLKVITQFDGVVCISKAVADELREWVRINVPDRLDRLEIRWFHLGADMDNSIPSLGMPENAGMILGKLSSRKSFLMVGTVEPRKRQDLALDAFEKLWNYGFDGNLVVVGKKGWMVDELCDRMWNHKENGKRLFWLEGISDEYLEKVYAASTCLIAASEGEGFGLPLIEAAQHKLPIIARDIPVFREVAGKFAYYFSGKRADDLASSIKEWVKLYDFGMHPRSDDMPWQTWKESTKQLLEAIGITEESEAKNV